MMTSWDENLHVDDMMTSGMRPRIRPCRCLITNWCRKEMNDGHDKHNRCVLTGTVLLRCVSCTSYVQTSAWWVSLCWYWYECVSVCRCCCGTWFLPTTNECHPCWKERFGRATDIRSGQWNQVWALLLDLVPSYQLAFASIFGSSVDVLSQVYPTTVGVVVEARACSSFCYHIKLRNTTSDWYEVWCCFVTQR